MQKRYAVIISMSLPDPQGLKLEEEIVGVHKAAFPAQKQREHFAKHLQANGYDKSDYFPFEANLRRSNRNFYFSNGTCHVAINVVPEFDIKNNKLWDAPDSA